MSLDVFGVTYTKVRDHYFAHVANFSTTSHPAASIVTEMIQDSAAELAGKLSAKGLDSADITSDDTPQAYQWCAETVRLGAAIRVAQTMTTQNPDVAKAWQAKLDLRFEALEEWGAEALGDATASTTGASIITHINNHSLDTTVDGEEPSNAIPFLRGDDDL